MKTQIFNTYSGFLNRQDKTTNGVSKSFAANNPNWEKENEDNEGCWKCSGCSRCSDCSGCSDCSDCSDCSRCSRCSGCSDCSDCSRCSDCSDCSGCSDCSDCSRCSGMALAKAAFEIPKIGNIHQKVLEAVSQPNALNMSHWHTCDTTHCRAGWVVFLAGEAGKELEKRTSTPFAAQQIYHASSEIKVSPPRFYESNEVAMKDIERCAEEEAKLIK